MDFSTAPKLPYCKYPKAIDSKKHGLQLLPGSLPIITLEAAQQFRSSKYEVVSTETLSAAQIIKMVKLIADSFAINEPMARHIMPPKQAPPDITGLKHSDSFGSDDFGEWTKENILFWVFRLFILTDAESPLDAIRINNYAIKQSLAVINKEGEMIGGAINVNLSIPENEQLIRNNDPFINAVLPFFEPVYHLLSTQMNLSLEALSNTFPEFKTALQNGKVGDLNLIARSPSLPTEDTFELVAVTAERFQQQGYEFLIVSAANQWTGAACEVLGGIKVHFAPYRISKVVYESADAVYDKASSIDGFISNKDSGCMLYVIRLQ